METFDNKSEGKTSIHRPKFCKKYLQQKMQRIEENKNKKIF